MPLKVMDQVGVSSQGQLGPVTPMNTCTHLEKRVERGRAGLRHWCFSFCRFFFLFCVCVCGVGRGWGGRSFKWIVAVSSAQESFISRQKGRQGCDSCLREETNGQPQPDI